MKAIRFIIRRLIPNFFVILAFILGIINNATATAITTTTGHPITIFPDTGTYRDVPKVDETDNNFITWTYDPALEALTSGLLTLPLPPKHDVIRTDLMDIENFPHTIPPVNQNFPVAPIKIVELKSHDFLNSVEIPEMFAANASVSQTWYDDDILPEVPIPEPGTLVLFVTAFGIFGYGRWRRRKHGVTQTSVTAVKIPVPEPHVQEERLAMVGKMAGEVMHDVKNALTGIRTCAEVLQYDDIEPEERVEFAKTVVEEVDRVFGMTQELLDFSYGGRNRLKLEVCSVKEFLQDLLSIIKPDFTSRGIAIRVDLRDTGELWMDVAKMKRVFMNIMTNARDAMPEGGTLTMTSRPIDDMVQIEFTDTGHGMSPELQACFLDPLVTEGKLHGTGLGMAIAKDILDEQHGQIEVESLVGQGTTIRILLPCIRHVSEG
ncbi:MAG: PEP-CTERM sorting domain-containing protein [bacterium]|nr:PEP-CTERM sorting domain-containing protein [bacterium]